MTVHIHPIGELVILAGYSMGKTERFLDYFYPRIPLQNVEDPAQRDPPQPKHHDHLIQRHVRSHQHRSRRP
jgi:hypothetical protein